MHIMMYSSLLIVRQNKEELETKVTVGNNNSRRMREANIENMLRLLIRSTHRIMCIIFYVCMFSLML